MAKMKSFTIFGFCVATLVLTLSVGPVVQQGTRAAGTPKPTPATELRVWQVLPSEPLMDGKSFSLYTAEPGQYVVYGRREYGINLVWSRTRPAVGNFTLVLHYHTTKGQIHYAELAALKESTGGYIYYKKREYGINLEFSRTPVYEWTVHGGNAGTPVVPGKWGDSATAMSDVRIALYNHTANCYMIYGEREYGINLKWAGGYRC